MWSYEQPCKKTIIPESSQRARSSSFLGAWRSSYKCPTFLVLYQFSSSGKYIFLLLICVSIGNATSLTSNALLVGWALNLDSRPTGSHGKFQGSHSFIRFISYMLLCAYYCAWSLSHHDTGTWQSMSLFSCMHLFLSALDTIEQDLVLRIINSLNVSRSIQEENSFNSYRYSGYTH